MRVHQEIIHTIQEQRDMLTVLEDYKKETATLLRDYLKEEKPLRGKEDYMIIRKPILDAYRARDKEIYDEYVEKAKERKYEIGYE